MIIKIIKSNYGGYYKCGETGAVAVGAVAAGAAGAAAVGAVAAGANN